MQTLFIISLGATALGGTGALSALYYYFRSTRTKASSPLSKAYRQASARNPRKTAARQAALSVASDPEGFRAVAAAYSQTSAETGPKNAASERLSRRAAETGPKNAALERLSHQAAEAAEALSRVMDAASPKLEAPQAVLTRARPYEFCNFDD